MFVLSCIHVFVHLHTHKESTKDKYSPSVFGMDGQASSENMPRTQTVAPKDATSCRIWASSAEHLHRPGARHVHASGVTMGPKHCWGPRAHSLLDEARGPAWPEDVRGRHSAGLSEQEGQTGTL